VGQSNSKPAWICCCDFIENNHVNMSLRDWKKGESATALVGATSFECGGGWVGIDSLNWKNQK
jgi:hypothetical protein